MPQRVLRQPRPLRARNPREELSSGARHKAYLGRSERNARPARHEGLERRRSCAALPRHAYASEQHTQVSSVGHPIAQRANRPVRGPPGNAATPTWDTCTSPRSASARPSTLPPSIPTRSTASWTPVSCRVLRTTLRLSQRDRPRAVPPRDHARAVRVLAEGAADVFQGRLSLIDASVSHIPHK